MDYLDLNTRLPPRKRLLAGLKKDSLECDLSTIFPLISGELYERLYEVINLSSHSVEEIIEEIKSLASDAAEAAEVARANSMEKAAAAVKAKSAAKSALELLDLVRENENQKICNLVKTKLRKRKGDHAATDEEISRRLHCSMNSSPRILNKSNRKNVDLFESVGELEDNAMANFSEQKRKLYFSVEKQYKGSKIVVGKKTKVKRKKLLLSQFNVRDRGKPEEL